MKNKKFYLMLLLGSLGVVDALAQRPSISANKPRVVITADPELDDNDTLIRAILYTTDFNVEGLVYQESTFHWKGDGKGTTQFRPAWGAARAKTCPEGCTTYRWPFPEKEAFIDHIVDAYAKVYKNLKVHNPEYPDPALLKSKIKWGNVEFEGDFSRDTDGSNLIKSLLMDDKPGPLYVTAQGGQSTIARALRSIYMECHDKPQWQSVKEKISRKLVIIPFGDQDGTYNSYIKPNWPDVAEWSLAMVEYGYGIRGSLSPENMVYISGPWTRENVLNQGPLGALYRVWQDGVVMDPTDTFGFTVDKLREMGRQAQEKDSFISEGDTPTFLNLLNNGLRAQNGRWGGWGGIWRDGAGPMLNIIPIQGPLPPDDAGFAPGLAAQGQKNPNVPDIANAPAPQARPQGMRRSPLPPEVLALNNRFFAASQNDFAARLKWSVTPNFKDANHEPKVTVKGPLDLTAKAGSTVALQGAASDPDHNSVKVKWWQYKDAGSYGGSVRIDSPEALKTNIVIPADAKVGDTIHLILEGTDSGTPALTQYQRVVITVQ
ncbi:DUF1593 domain-containing protein [Terriglobus albidus]|uniref:DUF1593 domain-containing protein n=1 Tax=Terriglobus albidus TaxID=1592106 RepID=A0A5B9EFW4_9BACT|nr:DUF1593 domain-containing protein [Terriglobus albidus]QEE28936.1 DUF1593 domain-containing protein [Terriglobus albidus]